MTEFVRVLLESSIRITASAALAGFALNVARVRSGAARHAVWTGSLFGMLCMPFLPYLVPAVTPPLSAPAIRVLPEGFASHDQARRFAAAMSQPAEPSPEALPAAAPVVSGAPFWPMAVLTLWLAGAVFLLVRFAAGWSATHRIIAASARVDDIGQLFESPLVAAPVAVGPIHCKVIVPGDWRSWTPDKLRAVLAHEFAHLRRRGPLVAALAALNRCIFWFHPLAWWLEKRLALTAEHAADDAALRAGSDSRRYADMLLDMAHAVSRRGGRLVWQSVGVDAPGTLGDRIERILRYGAAPSISRAQDFRRGIVRRGRSAHRRVPRAVVLYRRVET